MEWVICSRGAASSEEAPMTQPRNRVVQVSRFGGADGLEVVDAELADGRPLARATGPRACLESAYTDVLIRRHLYLKLRATDRRS